MLGWIVLKVSGIWKKVRVDVISKVYDSKI